MELVNKKVKRAPDTVGQSGQFVKTPCPQIIRARTAKDRVDNVDTHFQGLTQEKNHHIKKNEYGYLRSEKN